MDAIPRTSLLPRHAEGCGHHKMRRRSVTDKLIDQGRAGNKGCYLASWAFLLAVVALIVFGFKSCLGW